MTADWVVYKQCAFLCDTPQDVMARIVPTGAAMRRFAPLDTLQSSV